MADPSALLNLEFDRSGRQLTVYLEGEIGAGTGAGLASRILDRVRPSDAVVWIDLSALAACDPAGVAALESVSDEVRTMGATCMLYQPTRWVHRAILQCRVDPHLSIWPGDDPWVEDAS